MNIKDLPEHLWNVHGLNPRNRVELELLHRRDHAGEVQATWDHDVDDWRPNQEERDG